MTQKVWVVSITHKFGTNVSAFSSEEKAKEGVFSFVKEWREEVWREDDEDKEFNSLSKDDAIYYYFTNCDEFYDIEECEIE